MMWEQVCQQAMLNKIDCCTLTDISGKSYVVEYLIPKRHVKINPSIYDPVFVRVNLHTVIPLVFN